MSTTPASPPPSNVSKKPYARPKLRCYGRLEDLTRTATDTNNMNDMFGPAKT